MLEKLKLKSKGEVYWFIGTMILLIITLIFGIYSLVKMETFYGVVLSAVIILLTFLIFFYLIGGYEFNEIVHRIILSICLVLTGIESYYYFKAKDYLFGSIMVVIALIILTVIIIVKKYPFATKIIYSCGFVFFLVDHIYLFIKDMNNYDSVFMAFVGCFVVFFLYSSLFSSYLLRAPKKEIKK